MVFLSLAVPFVTLTLSSFALWTISFLNSKFDYRNWTFDTIIIIYLFLAEIDWAISAQYVLLFIKRSSMSLGPRMRSFLKPLGSLCLVFLSWPEPILGAFTVPLNFLLTLQSIPWGFLQEVYTNQTYQLSNLPNDNYTYGDSHESIRLEPIWMLGSFLNDFGLVQGLDCHYLIIIFNKDSIQYSLFIYLL